MRAPPFVLGLWVVFLLPVLLVAKFAFAGVTDPPSGGDALVTLLQATGFPTWAVVVAVMGKQVINQLKDISDRLERHVTQTESRLTRLEEVIRMRARARDDLPEI